MGNSAMACVVGLIWPMVFLWGVVIFGLASAIQYFCKFWGKVDSSIKHRRRQQLLRIERQRKRMMRSQAETEVSR